MPKTLPLSAAKARLSEVIRTVRRTGSSVLITVDGEAAATIAAVPDSARRLTPREVAASEALTQAVARIPRVKGSFDAVALVREGRR